MGSELECLDSRPHCIFIGQWLVFRTTLLPVSILHPCVAPHKLVVSVLNLGRADPWHVVAALTEIQLVDIYGRRSAEGLV